MVWYGMVWYGMVWYGMVWYGMVWYGMVWYGMVWRGMAWDCAMFVTLFVALFVNHWRQLECSSVIPTNRLRRLGRPRWTLDRQQHVLSVAREPEHLNLH